MPGTGRSVHVHLLCGLNGAGKMTYARRLEAELPAVRFTLDEWMLRLYQLRYDDPRYPGLAEACQILIWDMAKQILVAGVDVVLDWNQWSRERRMLWRDRVVELGYQPVLHYVRVPVETAIARADRRNRDGVIDAHVLDADGIRHLSGIFEAPTPEEGLEVRTLEA